MITREECLKYLEGEAKRYRDAPKEHPRYVGEFGTHWQKLAEIYEMAAKAVAEERDIR